MGKKINPWREGFCDAIMNRPCKSPWAESGYKHIKSNTLYLDGYLSGENNRERKGIKPMYTVEHTTYQHGDKQETETAFFNESDAREYARSCIAMYGGRAWVNNEEIKQAS